MNRGTSLYVVIVDNLHTCDEEILEVFFDKSKAEIFRDHNSNDNVKLELIEHWYLEEVKDEVVVTVNYKHLCAIDIHSNMNDAQCRIDNDAIVMWKTII